MKKNLKVGFVGMSHLGLNYAVATAKKNFDVITLGRQKSSDIKFDLLKNKSLKYKISCDILQFHS